MTVLKLANITFIIEKYFEPFNIDKYHFYSKHKETSKRLKRNNRKNIHNAFVRFSGYQDDSIIFKGGIIDGNRKRKFIEDILLIGSLLTSQNWSLYSRRHYPQYPALAVNHLNYICRDSKQVENILNKFILKINETSWQIQYENGFHLLMLFNKSNIHNYEGRFISYFTIWEWLYPHLKNPNGATSKDEEFRLVKIINYILNYYWGSKVNGTIFTNSYNNIYCCLRNQLVHSGKLPIDRDYAEEWMKNLEWESEKQGIKDYLDFFGLLTQVIILKTLDINSEESLKLWNFSEKLDLFLDTGKIDI